MNLKLRIAIVATLGSTSAFGAGSITIDSTLPGHASNTIVPLVGGTYTIPASQGFVSGPGNATHNLFHSFLTFNVDTAETAKFTNDLSGTYASSSFSNIISRVTGGTSTTIDGTIDSTSFPNANFWFVNPAGVVIGKNAVFNVAGTIALGAADYIQFTDARFYADPTQALTFTVASPSSFGFLPTSNAGSFQSNGWNLVEEDTGSGPSSPYVPYNKIAHGNVIIAGGSGVTLIDTSIDTYGTFNLSDGATGNAGDIRINSFAGNVTLQGQTQLQTGNSSDGPTASIGNIVVSAGGTVQMLPGSSIRVDARQPTSGQLVDLEGADISIIGNTIDTPTFNISTLNNGTGPGIHLIATNSVVINNAAIANQVNSTGSTGEVLIQGRDISIIQPTTQAIPTIESYLANFNPSTNGRAGPITIEATGTLSLNGASIVTATNTLDTGTSSGDITLTGNVVSLDNGTNIRSENIGVGKSGAINITGTTSVTSNIGSNGLPVTGVNGQPITIFSGGSTSTVYNNASNQSVTVAGIPQDIAISGGAISLYAANVAAETSNVSKPTPASVTLTATTGGITLAGNTVIRTDTSALSDAGSIYISAPSGLFTILDSSGLIASSYAGGAAGNIQITAGNMMAGDPSLTDYYFIRPHVLLQSIAEGSGSGGKLTIDVPGAANFFGVQVDTQATRSQSTSGGGSAGSIDIHAGTLTMAGSSIVAASSEIGSAGAVWLHADQDVVLSNTNVSSSSGAATTHAQVGSGDFVKIEAGRDIQLVSSIAGATVDGSEAAPGANSNANAGQTILNAGRSVIVTNSSLDSSVNGAGNAGGISITAGADVQISGAPALRFIGTPSAAIASQATNSGNAGDVQITANAGTVHLYNGAAIATSADQSSGYAGVIGINASAIQLDSAALSSTVATLSPVGTPKPASITLTASGSTSLTNSLIDARTSGAVDAGSVSITGGSVSIIGGQQPAPVVVASGVTVPESNVAAFSVTTSTGHAGEIDINASKGAFTINGATDSGTGLIATSYSTGGAGTVRVLANSVTAGISSPSGYGNPISSNGVLIESAAQGSGPGGDVVISATGAVNFYGIFVTTEALPLIVGTSGGAAGSINVTGGTVGIDGSTVTTHTSGAGIAGNITVTATGPDPRSGSAALQVTGGSSITSDANGGQTSSANAGLVTLMASAGTVQVGLPGDTTPTTISSSAGASAGTAGTVTIAGNSIVLDDADVSTTAGGLTTTLATAAPGTITLSANNGTGPLTVANSTLDATTTGAQKAGEIDLSGSQIAITNSTLSSKTTTASRAGDINVTAGGALQITSPGGGRRSAVSTSSTSTASSAGAAGTISLTGSSLMIDASDVTATIDGGNIDTLLADIAFNTSGAVAVTGGSTIKADTSGGARGGAIDFGTAADSTRGIAEAPIASLKVNGGSKITVDASGIGATAGKGGTLVVTSAGPVTLSGKGTTLSSNSSNDAVGGSVTITGSSLSMDSGAQATANTSSSGVVPALGTAASTAVRIKAAGTPAPRITGGDVLVTTTGDVALAGAGTEISANATGGGSGGKVTINSTGLSLTEGALIATTATAAGNSGDVAITVTPPTPVPGGPPVPPLLLAGNSQITTNADASTGGNITVNAGGSPLTLHSSVINATAGKTGNGGNITINNVGQTILQNSAILARADSGNGGAININLKSGALFIQDSQSLVSAQSKTGNSGTVSINAPQTDLNSGLAVPEVSVARAAELTSNACRHDASHSTFVREGRGGITRDPDGYLTSQSTNGTASPPSAATKPATSFGSADRLTFISAAAASVDQGCL